MDMCVDLRTLSCLRGNVDQCRRRIENAANGLNGAVARAGASLEGRQYCLAQEQTNATYNAVIESSGNLHKVENFLGELEGAVRRYLSCKYSG